MEHPPTLLIRRLPAILSSTEKEDLLRHFGSQSVYVFPSKGPMKNCATATFPTHDAAVQALHRLHQLEVFGRRLIVEFAQHSLKYSTHQRDNDEDGPPHISRSSSEQDQPVEPTMDTQRSTDQSKETTSQEQQQQLCYLYPPPSPAIVSNIAHVLSCVPSFYEQVLHLMNKMNLPAPFCQPPLFTLDQNQWGEWQQRSDDSELESDGEQPSKELQPKAKKEAKRRKISFRQAKEAGPVTKKPLLEQEDNPLIKKIVLKVPQELTKDEASNDATATTTAGGFGMIEPVVQPVEVEVGDAEQDGRPDQFITADELKENRLSHDDLTSHPAFRNYSRGDPTTRLYIKNLAKNVTEQDLTSIYGRYIDYNSEMHTSVFNIRLMTTGRMKGQAFIGLPSEDIALQAITDTNGYQLKGKPIVVQFARSAKAT